jgi:hypothetical protein
MKRVKKTVTIDLADATAGHRQATQLRADRLGVGRAFGQAQIDNGWLIFCCHGVTGEPRRCGGTPARVKHALEAASHQQNTGFGQGEGAAMGRCLNAFFAISVNSPPMGMVNFCCCVCSAPKAGARGVTRRVTPQPMRAAVRMEAGAYACL